MGNFSDLNPVRDRVSESLTEFGAIPDITLGRTSFTFSVCADIHTGSAENEVFSKILQEAQDGGDQFLITVGDLVNWGKNEEYNIFNDQISRYTNIPHGVFNTIGNHDIFWGGWSVFKKLFGPSVYTFVTENSRFIFLDSANGTLGVEQLDWLENTLKGNTKPNIFVFSHMGVFTGSFSSLFKLDSQEEIYRFMHLLTKYNVDYLFSGHLHIYLKKEIEGVNYIITGGAGIGILDSGNNHFIRVTVDGDSITTTKIDIN